MSDKSIYLIGAIFLLVTALFSSGYHQFDEHFQILEFAGLKLHSTTTANLAWEYHYQTRAAIQPAIVVLICSFLSYVKITDPFIIATFLRILSGILSFLSVHLFYKYSSPRIEDILLRKWFLLLSFLLWFIVYNNVRFSSENWSGSVFLIAFSLYFSKISNSRSHYLFIGILFGLSFLFRYQVGLLVAGFMLWLHFINKEHISHLILLSAGIMFSVTSGVIIDRWFYCEWTLTARNYLVEGLVLGKLSEFGVEPWWYYLEAVFVKAAPPIGIVCILSLLIVLIFKRKDVVIWTILPFILVHTFIGHKETRYLFPISGFVPVLIIRSIEIMRQRCLGDFLNTALFRKAVNAFWVVNIFILGIVAIRPADPNIALYRTIFKNYKGPATLYYIGGSPYQRVKLELSFYRRPNLRTREILAIDEIDLDSDRACLFITRKPDLISKTGHQFKLIYSTLPEWVKMLNFNNWIERTKLWYVYEISAGDSIATSPHSPISRALYES